MKIFGFCVLGIFVALVLFMVIRTVLSQAKKQKPTTKSDEHVDVKTVAEHLKGAIRIPTITMKNNDGDGSIFFKYQEYLEKTYPLIMAKAKKTNINKYAVIYEITGSDKDLLPIAILAHQDVVTASPEGWEVDPFSAEEKDGYIYGRGSVDMKSQMIVALEGLENLLAKGFEPKRSIFFCFGHDEELKGIYGAKHIVMHLKERGIRFESVIDEGGTILDGKILGIDNKVALIGICEKGYADIKIEVEKKGGHASTPTRRTSVGLLSEALFDIEAKQPKPSWTKPTKRMLSELAPYMNFGFRFVMINRDILSPILKPLLCLISPFTNSLLRTTMAPTQATGADTPNTLPTKAVANVNVRINTGETAEQAKQYIQDIVGKYAKVSLEEGYIDPSPVSDVDSEAYEKLAKCISDVFGGYVVAPYPFIAASDAKYYYALSNNVYRFTPFIKSEEDANRIHGLNERLPIESLDQATVFYMHLYREYCG